MTALHPSRAAGRPDAISWALSRINWLEVRAAFAETLALLITIAITARPALIAASQALGSAWVAVLGLAPTSTAPEAPQSACEAAEAPKAAFPAPRPFEPVLADLSALRVSELRKLARQQGLGHLGRRGRKAELLEALAS